MTLHQAQQRAREIAQRQITASRMSIKLLSAKSGYTQAHVSNWLHRDRDMSLPALGAILSALGLGLELVPTERKPHEPQKQA